MTRSPRDGSLAPRHFARYSSRKRGRVQRPYRTDDGGQLADLPSSARKLRTRSRFRSSYARLESAARVAPRRPAGFVSQVRWRRRSFEGRKAHRCPRAAMRRTEMAAFRRKRPRGGLRKTPNLKLQTPNKFQISNSNLQTKPAWLCLEFGVWNLDFGIFDVLIRRDIGVRGRRPEGRFATSAGL